ncbi:MAG TPA: glycosyltransferase family 4 protein [Herpetosiphonaceae bacterium]
MRIAQIAPLFEAVPPPFYGGTERVVGGLCEELVRRGHEVTLFASGDSRTSARLRAIVPRSLRTSMSREEMLKIAPALHDELFATVYSRADEFDIIHSHVEYRMEYNLPYARTTSVPTVTTMHGVYDEERFPILERSFPDAPFTSISLSQARPMQAHHLNWVGCVYNSVPLDRFPFQPQPGDYLAFVGRICPQKGPAAAVEVALRTGLKLKVGAKIDEYDWQYWKDEIEPLFETDQVEFLGEVDERQKAELMGNAYATLLPINWPEPFGLVMVESLACGTPVIALNRGAVPEIIRDGVSGFICDSVDQMVAAVGRVSELDRRTCRRDAERFSPERMCAGYEQIYRQLIAGQATTAEFARHSQMQALQLGAAS